MVTLPSPDTAVFQAAVLFLKRQRGEGIKRLKSEDRPNTVASVLTGGVAVGAQPS